MKKQLKWVIPVILFAGIGLYLFTSSGMGKVASNLAQAYADENLYSDAIEKANSDPEVIRTLGEIQAIDRMTILNGEVMFSEDNQSVNSTIKLKGSNMTGKMDIVANRQGEAWHYESIRIRYQDTDKNKQSIQVVK